MDLGGGGEGEEEGGGNLVGTGMGPSACARARADRMHNGHAHTHTHTHTSLHARVKRTTSIRRSLPAAVLKRHSMWSNLRGAVPSGGAGANNMECALH